MTRCVSTIAAVALALGFAVAQPAQADLLLFTSTLLPENELHTDVQSNAAGVAIMSVDTDTGLFDLTLWVTGIDQADLTANPFHIHIGGPEVSGGIIFGFLGVDNDWTTNGSLLVREIVDAQFDQAFIDTYWDDLLAGDTYLNVHTSAYPPGEIRGQLIPVPEPTSLGLVAIGVGVMLTGRRRRAT
ncbi:MAG: CHRD domain-containing protein [Phycisphaeraceae bacterium]